MAEKYYWCDLCTDTGVTPIINDSGGEYCSCPIGAALWAVEEVDIQEKTVTEAQVTVLTSLIHYRDIDGEIFMDLVGALKKCAAVVAGHELSKSSLIDALESARTALMKATGEKLE